MLDQIGQYKILARIGEGGMGEVYRARDVRHGRTVAIKVLSPDIAGNPERRERFAADARAASRLSHPNSAILYELGEDHDQLFVAFEFVPGETLGATVAGRPMNARVGLHLAGQLADALADAHALGIVHGDLRAGSVIVTPKGNAKLLDCGLSAWTRHAASRPAVVAEDPAADAGLDVRGDTWGLGVLLYEMLTGRHPFPADGSPAAAAGVSRAQPVPPSAINRTLPKDLDAIVAKALSTETGLGYASAAMFAADIRAVDEMLAARAASADRTAPPAPVARAPRGRPALAWTAAALTAAAVLAAWWILGR